MQDTATRHFLERAIALAESNVLSNTGGPFGAVIVRSGSIIAEGQNMVTLSNDPTAHAEIVAIRQACQAVGKFSLEGCDIYCSCEPCPMCLSAIYWARLSGVYFAATKEDAADAGFDDSFLYREVVLPLAERSILAMNDLRAEGQRPMQLWKKAVAKTLY